MLIIVAAKLGLVTHSHCTVSHKAQFGCNNNQHQRSGVIMLRMHPMLPISIHQLHHHAIANGSVVI